ncbi:hypothetical protein C8R41DRAFT_984829 [Lentinula lateritia]|uniref:Uncharacterized protein n=1 Tax=Lentinula lateritia TaxID=40482 RepID=A0ABQ8UZQ7_9AGAR|nr:hypothetical protein C8R41DRAFT_984829 [Lentinula lateritia]
MAFSSAIKSLTQAAFPKRQPTPALATQVTTTLDAVDSDREVDPTSDAALSLSSSFPSFASFKDQRAFEHERQCAKRTEEYARTQDAKASKGLSKWRPALPVHQRRTTSARKGRPVGFGGSEDEANTPNVLERVRSAGTRKESSPVQNSEVKLADLIKPGSVRKARKNKEADFELIPAVRPVIVLDELAFMHDVPAPRDLEQEWQHVYHSDGDDSDASLSISTPTYANVVLGGLS